MSFSLYLYQYQYLSLYLTLSISVSVSIVSISGRPSTADLVPVYMIALTTSFFSQEQRLWFIYLFIPRVQHKQKSTVNVGLNEVFPLLSSVLAWIPLKADPETRLGHRYFIWEMIPGSKARE